MFKLDFKIKKYLRSWETIFSKSTFNITENELKCCYRIIDLCKDCVLIVYQYAFEQNQPVKSESEGKSVSSNKLNNYTRSKLSGSASNLSNRIRYK